MTDGDVAALGTRFDWLASDGTAWWWLEFQPPAGRAVVMRSDITRLSAYRAAVGSIGSGLHTYGGRPYAVVEPGRVVAVDASTGQFVGLPPGSGDRHGYGDLGQGDGEVLAVRESEAGDDLVAITPDRPGIRLLRSVGRFIASPRWAAGRLAWTQWDATVMPWDSCEVWIADYTAGGRVVHARRVAGGPGESAVQPVWADHGALYFMSDRSGWWNLYRWHNGETEAVAPMPEDCAAAPWRSGYATYALLPGGRIAMTAQQGPQQRLLIVNPDGSTRPVDLPYTSIKACIAVCGDLVGLIGATPDRHAEVALVATDGTDAVEVIRRPARSTAAGPVSIPELLRVDAPAGPVTVLFYPPAPAAHGLPPLIVRPHTGPTHHSDLHLDPEVQFFTSRGFAVADVDYRGSTGYGRAFRKALDGNWGRYDVEDCQAAAHYLIADGRVHPDTVFISGASAGGYTALKAACHNGPFALAVARSAIVNPQTWRTTAPRFQRPHAAILASATSPVHADQVRRPVLLVHGTHDAVAPIGDADTLAQKLRHRGLLAGMLRFDGAGHYLTAAAQQQALDAELAAYRVVLDRE